MMRILREMIREIIASPATKVIKVEGFPIEVEVADSPGSQSRGLMNRDHLDPDCGMLFCYEEPTRLSFWMRNTRIPLTIAFIDNDERICELVDMEPFNENLVKSSIPCRWALEVNRGWFESRNLRVGCKISGL